MKAQKGSLTGNVTILARLGCLDEEGMTLLRKGNAPTVKKGPYVGEIVTGNHIANDSREICRLVCKKCKATHDHSHQGAPLRMEH